MTYVVAIHDIRDPKQFWGTAGGGTDFPAGITLHSSYPRADGSRAVCLWEADSVDTVREFVDGAVGEYSRNEFFEVDPGHAGTSGLPASAAIGA